MVSLGNISRLFLVMVLHDVGFQCFILFGTNGLSLFFFTILFFLPFDFLQFFPSRFARRIPPSSSVSSSSENWGEVNCVGKTYVTSDTNESSNCCITSLFTLPTSNPSPMGYFGAGTRLSRSKLTSAIFLNQIRSRYYRSYTLLFCWSPLLIAFATGQYLYPPLTLVSLTSKTIETRLVLSRSPIYFRTFQRR